MQVLKENKYLARMNLPECIPDKVKISFFESKRKEWAQVAAFSQGALFDEGQPEYLHWKQINVDANERIREIDEKIGFLKLKLQ